LYSLFGKHVRAASSGRTDTGVHALAQVATFTLPKKFPVPSIPRALNSLLPPDIKVLDAREVDEKFHARFDAKSKRYVYVILHASAPLPIGRAYYHFVPFHLNVRALRKASRVFLGKHDFRNFCKHARGRENTVRTVYDIKIIERAPFVRIEIEANGFLHSMVRQIVGSLIEAGRAKLTPAALKKILRSRKALYKGQTAPGKGLFLKEVAY